MSGQCESATFFPDKLCSHFATDCVNLAESAGAITVKPQTNYQWTLVDYGAECQGTQLATSSKVDSLSSCLASCQSEPKCSSASYLPDKTCKHFGGLCPQTKASAKAVSMVQLKQALACNTQKGEIYLQASSGKVKDLEACQNSCDNAPKCQSTTYFFADEFCSHFSTACKNRIYRADAISKRQKIFTTTTTTTTTGSSGATSLTQPTSMQTYPQPVRSREWLVRVSVSATLA